MIAHAITWFENGRGPGFKSRRVHGLVVSLRPGKDFIGVGVGAFIVKDGKLLLLKRKKPPEKGKWMIPGGKVEFGETLEEALKKEIQEELGVKCKIKGLLCVADHILPEEKTHFVSPTLLVELEGEPKLLEPNKHERMKWFPLDALPENLALVNQPAVSEYKKYWGEGNERLRAHGKTNRENTKKEL